jgi:hypothetical protein
MTGRTYRANTRMTARLTPGQRRSGFKVYSYFGVSFSSLLVGGVFGLIEGVPLSVQT